MKIIYALFMLLLLPAAIAIDAIAGDSATGVKSSLADKIRDHKRAWMILWNSA